MTASSTPLSILDLAHIGRGQSVQEAIASTVALAQRAEQLGYRSVWYAEHHNIPSIASSATSVLIAHVAAHTSRIKLGAGGIMLPNHSPLVIAEQFGTLESLHPGRIELGLGRAPGGDQTTLRALRRSPLDADGFPDDVLELQGYLGDTSRVRGVRAIPGHGTHVPLTILGSSLFGARLAARLGLPYGFASHFAPAALHDAVAIYRREFQPSAQLDRPHVIAGINVTAADTREEAQAQHLAVMRQRVLILLGRTGDEGDAQADLLLASPGGRQIAAMMRYSAVGTAPEVRDYLDDFAAHADADELMVVHATPGLPERLRSATLLAEARGMPTAAE